MPVDGAFNEATLREHIAHMWGESGAHVEVYDDVLHEIASLREVVRELVRNDGLYGGAPMWQSGSRCAKAYERAMEGVED